MIHTDAAPLLTTTQAADVLGVSRPVVRAMVRRGELAGMQVAGRCYVDREQVEKLVAARRTVFSLTPAVSAMVAEVRTDFGPF